MKNRSALGILVVSLSIASSSAFADDIQSLSHGTFRLLPVNTPGEVVSCELEAPPIVARISVVYKYFEGVCDDRGEVPCAGRLRAVNEWCVGDSTTYGDAGAYTTTYGGPQAVRICFNETDDSCSEFAEVSTAEVTRRHVTFALPGEAALHAHQAISIDGGRPFFIDGRMVRIRPTDAIDYLTWEATATEDSCLVSEAGCGLVSTAVASSSRPKRHRDRDHDHAD